MNKSKNKENRVYIMGRIVLIDVKIAEAADNPYNLSMGTPYSICYVTCLKPDDIKKNNGINLLKRLNGVQLI